MTDIKKKTVSKKIDDKQVKLDAQMAEIKKMRESNLAAKMFYIKSLIKNVQEDLDIGRYKAISHNMITKTVSKPMNLVGVFYIPHCKSTVQDGNRTEVVMALEFINVDNPQERMIVGDYVGYGIDSQDKGPGKAYSYAIKYILLKTFGILTGEDDQDESELDNKPAETVLTDVEKAANSAREMYKDFALKIKEMNINEAKQYWDNVKTNKKASLEYIKLNNNPVYVSFNSQVQVLIKAMEEKNDA